MTPLRRKDSLYLQVLAAVAVGILIGCAWPNVGVQLKPLGDGFIKAVRMLVSPIIFTTVVIGIAGMGDLKKAGRIGGKALLYFEVMTTLALIIGLVVANGFGPGHGIHAKKSDLDPSSVATYVTAAKSLGWVEMLLHMIPGNFFGAFVDGDPLPVLVLAIVFGLAVSRFGEQAKPVVAVLSTVAKAFFGVMAILSRFAPLAALGAMSYTIAKFGPGTLVQLGSFLACVYLTCILFVVICLGIVARLAGFNLFRILRCIREEIFLVLGTSSSESALPGVMQRLEEAGCDKAIVDVVIPAGYSFNLDGTCIYLTLATLFIAQAMDVHLSLGDQLYIVGVLLFVSKGAAAVTGGGFITLAAVLPITGKLPVEGIALLLGIDRFMSEARAITNLIGNAVATLFIAKWEKAFDPVKGRFLLAGSKTQS